MSHTIHISSQSKQTNERTMQLRVSSQRGCPHSQGLGNMPRVTGQGGGEGGISIQLALTSKLMLFSLPHIFISVYFAKVRVHSLNVSSIHLGQKQLLCEAD